MLTLAQVRPGFKSVYGVSIAEPRRDVVEVIDELVIPENSNTGEACRALAQRLQQWASGRSRWTFAAWLEVRTTGTWALDQNPIDGLA